MPSTKGSSHPVISTAALVVAYLPVALTVVAALGALVPTLAPFVLKTGWWMTKGGEWEKSRAQTDRMGDIVSKLAKEFDAVHVPTQAVFDAAAKAAGPEQWIWDGVHPLPQGHELIARRWIEEVSARWRG